MTVSKKYFYLKLKDNFFDLPEIKVIEGLQNGYEYICIMQKMYLRSLSRDGKLMLTDMIPYEIATLSSVLGHKQETITAAIKVFKSLNLLEILDDMTIYMTEIQNFIGESSTEADRIRAYRKEIEENKKDRILSLNKTIKRVQMYNKSTPELKIELDPKIEKE